MAETSISQTAIYSARPTLRIAGAADERVTELLAALRMEESVGGMSRLELRFANWVATGSGNAELGFAANASLRLGAELQVGCGDTEAPLEIFKGLVSGLEMVCNYGQPPELVVLAEDPLGNARRARRTKTYDDMSPADVITAVAGDLGLTPDIEGLSGPRQTWVQLNESDLAFLRRLVARFDADLQLVGPSLQVRPRGAGSRGCIELQLYSQLARVRISADLSDQVTAVTVAGWNANAGSAVSSRASSLAHGGPGQGRDGITLARELLGERSEHLSFPPVSSDDQAQAVAQAALDQRARRFVRATGLAEGNPRLRVGAEVRLVGISSQFDNRYEVVAACHLFDLNQGYRTEFVAECAYLGTGP